MTVQEAKKILEYYYNQEWFLEKDQPAKNSLQIAIESMKELEQYRALGTVEELKEAREKQVAKRPKDMQDDANGIDVWVTCECGAMMLINTDLHKQGYCRKCGQLMEFPQPYKKEGAD